MSSPTDSASARQRFQGPVLRTGVFRMKRSSNSPTLNPTPAPPHPPVWPYHWPSQLVEVSHLHRQPPENNLRYLHLVFTARNKSYLLFLWAMKTWKTIPWRKAIFSAVISLCSNRFRGIFCVFRCCRAGGKRRKSAPNAGYAVMSILRWPNNSFFSVYQITYADNQRVYTS